MILQDFLFLVLLVVLLYFARWEVGHWKRWNKITEPSARPSRQAGLAM
jgi:hypothetical protein